MKFLSSEITLYLYKFIIRPCMKCCCHVWAGASSSYLELLDNLQKRGRSTGYFDRLYDISVTIRRCYKDVYVNSFFSYTARLEFSAYRMLSFCL